MYLLYADESGDLGDAASNVLVIAGIAVHEDAIRPFAGAVNRTIDKFIGAGPGRQIELHGAPMRMGKGDWKGISYQKRSRLFHEILELVCNWSHPSSSS